MNEIVEVDEDVEEVVDQTDIEETADQTDIEETADPTEDEETPEDEEALTPDQIVDTRIRLDCLAPYIKDKRNETDGFKKEYIVGYIPPVDNLIAIAYIILITLVNDTISLGW